MKKRSVALLLLVAMLVFTVTAYARYANIRKTVVSLAISGDATCQGSVTAKSSSAPSSITVTLQKQDANGTTWSYVNSWTASGTGSAALEKKQSISSGTYRVKLAVNVDGETMTDYSPIWTK